jgi:virginiamycin A acetyltransferase
MPLPVFSSPKVTIGEDCWVGNGALIMANIGDKCIVGAASVVTKDIPDYSIVAGNPAKIIRNRKDMFWSTLTGHFL